MKNFVVQRRGNTFHAAHQVIKVPKNDFGVQFQEFHCLRATEVKRGQRESETQVASREGDVRFVPSRLKMVLCEERVVLLNRVVFSVEFFHKDEAGVGGGKFKNAISGSMCNWERLRSPAARATT